MPQDTCDLLFYKQANIAIPTYKQTTKNYPPQDDPGKGNLYNYSLPVSPLFLLSSPVTIHSNVIQIRATFEWLEVFLMSHKSVLGIYRLDDLFGLNIDLRRNFTGSGVYVDTVC